MGTELTARQTREIAFAGATLDTNFQAQAIQLGEAMAASGFFPGVKDAAQAAVKILMGHELGLSPVASVNDIDVIAIPNRPPKMRVNGRATGQLLRQHGYTWETIEHTSEICKLRFFKDGQVVKYKMTEDSPEGVLTYSKAEAAMAGLVKDGSAWKVWSKNMTYWRVLTQAAKFFAGEIFDTAPAEIVYQEDLDAGPITTNQIAAIQIRCKELGISKEQREADLGGRSSSEITYGEAQAYLRDLEERRPALPGGEPEPDEPDPFEGVGTPANTAEEAAALDQIEKRGEVVWPEPAKGLEIAQEESKEPEGVETPPESPSAPRSVLDHLPDEIAEKARSFFATESLAESVFRMFCKRLKVKPEEISNDQAQAFEATLRKAD